MGQVIIEITHASLKDWFLPLELLTHSFSPPRIRTSLPASRASVLSITLAIISRIVTVVTYGAQGRSLTYDLQPKWLLLYTELLGQNLSLT